MNKKYTLILLGIIVLGVVVISTAFAFVEQARTESVQLFGKENARVLYSAFDGTGKNAKLTSLDFGIFKDTEILKENQGVVSQKVFISPNRELLAVMIEINPHNILTYISDLTGNIIVAPYSGIFGSWALDSKKIVLSLPIELSGSTDLTYYLDMSGNYYDSELPNEIISASVASNGKVVYTLGHKTGFGSDIYIRDTEGKDHLLLEGREDIFAWVTWSPDEDKIAFLKDKPTINVQGKISWAKTVWVVNSDGTGLTEISDVRWNYPPVWSPDGTKVVFSNGANILEYSMQQKEIKQTTDFVVKSVQRPNYSADGQTIVFSDGRQIWSARNGVVTQLTEGDQIKDYPILP